MYVCLLLGPVCAGLMTDTGQFLVSIAVCPYKSGQHVWSKAAGCCSPEAIGAVYT